MNFPAMIRIRQRFPARPVVACGSVVGRDLPPALANLRPAARVAVAVGSRGISNLQDIVRAVVETVRTAGHRPFIVPAMGSHGGGTAAGQTALLAAYGVTESALGVPIESSMEVRSLGATALGLETVVCGQALDADGLILINRVKPHTDFAGAIGSGLLKMLVVGLGKHAGAARFHAAASRHGYETVLRDQAQLIRRNLRLLAGIALLEDQRHDTACVEVVLPENLEAREAALCAAARNLMPRLPCDDIDLLIVDRMGKNISGTGMDPLVIGRWIHGYSLAEDAPRPSPRIRRLFVRELTPESHGNAIGLGLADFTTARLVRAMDRHITTVNSLTALSLQGAKIPLYFDTDREVLERALPTLALPDPAQARIVRIRDTLSLEVLDVSTALLPELERRPDLELIGEPRSLEFDAAGTLAPLEPDIPQGFAVVKSL